VAVLLEPVQGEAGVIEATADFLRELRALCDAHGLLLMFDEVQTGVGRTGTLWGWQASGVKPDVMTLGKGLGGGAPIGALLAREAVCCFVPGDQGGTYHGNPLMCAAGLAILEAVTRSGFLEHTRARGQQLQRAAGHRRRDWAPAPCAAAGCCWRWTCPGPTRRRRWPMTLRRQADGRQPGLLLNAVRPQRLRFVPALNIGADEVDLALQMLRRALACSASGRAPPRARPPRRCARHGGPGAGLQPLRHRGHHSGVGPLGPAAVERRRRRVLDAQLHRLRT
jgi:acetylornithine/N-succinyldiaminopimelate aminotransferase